MTTLNREITICGKCLMKGQTASVKIVPSLHKGIRFYPNNSNEAIEAKVNNVISTEHCTVLGSETQQLMTIEHFMAACAICNLDSLDVYVDTFEMPILDGSSKIWIEEFQKAGITESNHQFINISKPVFLDYGKTQIVMTPSDALKISYMVNFNHPELKNKWVSLNNIDEIKEARTFGFLKDLEAFQKAGYALGADIDNTVGLAEEGYTTALRSDLEPAKHKILDLIGDLYLTGVNPLHLNVNIIVKEAGHKVHVEFAKILMQELLEEI